MTLQSLVPEPQLLLEMHPDEVGGLILQMLHQGARANNVDPSQHKVNRYNFSLNHTVREYPQQMWPQLQRLLMEGWMWLENEGFLAHIPEEQGEWFFITRKGQRYRSATDLRTYREAARFPRSLLHPDIEQRVWGDFVRGEYDTAVFKAFRDVEVAVRRAAQLPDSDIGVALMRKAFGDGGPLEDTQLEKGEQQAMREFFSGATGMFKNPQSHRHVALAEPEETFEMLIIASHLMRIVDARLTN